MMKKRSMAMAMAAVTVATSVAPVMAAETTVVKETVTAKSSGELVSKVGELLNVKYTQKDTNGNVTTTDECVYTITVNDTQIKTTLELSKAIKALAEGAKLTVKITDKGHRIAGNEIVKTQAPTYTVKEITTIDKTANEAVIEKVTISNDAVATVVLKETGKQLTFKAGNEKVDFAKPVDSEGKVVVKSGESFTAEELKKIVGFEKVAEVDIAEKLLAEVTVTNSTIEKVTIDKLYDGLRLTKEGTDLLNAIGSILVDEDGNKFELQASASTVTEVEKDKLYSMNISLTKGAASKTLVEGAYMTITVESTDKANLVELAKIVNDGVSRINVLAGDDRYTTAVEVSKELRKDQTKVDGSSVVLVNSEALVDGLAATPFATAVKAPVLLTAKDAVPTATMDEVKDVLNHIGTAPADMKKKTIYLIGGENVISADVEAELAKLGATIVRLAGADRHETSLAVAEAMAEKATISKAFVVGATGEADAMSIAGYAAQTTSPIIVNGWSGISKDAVKLLNGKEMTIIGGEKAVNKTVEAELKVIDKDKNIERVTGATRHETNANVIDKFYNGDLKNVFVAKDGYVEGNGKLVDALAAGTLAAAKNAPIVLATSDLTVSQDEVLTLKLNKDETVYQVGNGVQMTVIQKIAKKLGLN